MSKIISLAGQRNGGLEITLKKQDADLNDLIKEAKLLCQDRLNLADGKIVYLAEEEFRKLIERQVMDSILRQRLFASEFFFCGKYVADILCRLIKETPDSWYAVDYYLKGLSPIPRKITEISISKTTI